ncbi:prepilin-type N-terminal cleavage/methylation domain-containing protein [Candidatus Gracilibacteria bacterium]|nr:prepilin-type N-terminal cleavage/methylation domain-containing protein [Candidatus Gracilibacteria bacterium]
MLKIRKNFFGQKKKSAFTLMEIMVSIAILGIISAGVFSVLGELMTSGKLDKSKIEMNSEIVDAVASVKNYLKNGDEIKILKSNIYKDNILGEKFNGVLIKNKKNNGEKKSLFTLIKPLETSLSGDFGEKTIGDKNYHLGITDLNLFSDLQKDGNNLYFTDPGNGLVWKCDLDFTDCSQISGWGSGKFLTPTGIAINSNNLYFSDTYQNLIFRVPKNDFSNDKVENIAGKIGTKINPDTGEESNYVISGFKDGNFGRNTLNHPKGLVIYDGYLYFADSGNNAVRVVNLTNYNIETYIGTGDAGIVEDGVFPGDFLLNNPTGLAIRGDIGMLLISDTDNNRIVAVGPFSGNNSYYKPFTIAGIGKKDERILTDGFFGGKDEFVGSLDDVIEKERNVGEMGFGGDFLLANNAILNHPTGIKFYGSGGFVFADSGNNLIRKVQIWKFSEDDTKTLFSNFNRIETIIGNAGEILIYEDETGSGTDIKMSTSAPQAGNGTGFTKEAMLDNPMGIAFSGSDILFTDLQLSKKNLYGKINYCSGDCFNGSGNVVFMKEKAFTALNIDKISITNLDDFISKNSLDVMQFIERRYDELKLISFYLKFVDFVKGKKVDVDIRTSVENRLKN